MIRPSSIAMVAGTAPCTFKIGEPPHSKGVRTGRSTMSHDCKLSMIQSVMEAGGSYDDLIAMMIN